MPLLSVSRFSKGVGLDYLASSDVDGVENHLALGVSAGSALAFNLKPPIVGQTAVECSAAP